ncbi:MAG: thioredoxin domain-containing protein [Bacillota bacterium]
MDNIEWMPWSEKAFELAQKQEKPVLLSIGATWCHWCHVMERTSYSDPRVIKAVQEGYVPVRVDTDKRPDINRRYNMGGWPTTAFLTPSGELITGATYIPPDALVDVLKRVSDYYREHGDLLEFEYNEKEKAPGEIGQGITLDVASQALDVYDTKYGGFGSQPKFLHIDTLRLLNTMWMWGAGETYGQAFLHTLKKMSEGAIHDRVEGGFFRYATQRDWSVPHYEKMLEDNAGLLELYVRAYQSTGDGSFLDVVKGIIGYMESTLASPDGGFWGSQDADEEYYSLDWNRRNSREAPSVDKTVYTDKTARVVRAYLAASAIVPDLFQRAESTLDFLLEKAKSTEDLFYHYRDESSGILGLFADQVQMAGALVASWTHTGSDRRIEAARRVVRGFDQFLTDSGYADTRCGHEQLGLLRFRYTDITENAEAAEVLVDLYLATGEDGYFVKAKRALRAFAGDYKREGIMACSYALAVKKATDLAYVSIYGRTENEQTRELERAVRRQNLPGVLVVREKGGEPSVSVCSGGVCHSRLTQPEEVKDLLRLLRRFR